MGIFLAPRNAKALKCNIAAGEGITLAICNLHDKVKSIYIPNIRIYPFGYMFVLFILTGSFILNFLEIFVR